MKAIIAVSVDGFCATGPQDDMKWTGTLDKAFFKLYTLQAKRLYCGSTTYEMMPKNLVGRTLTRVTKQDFECCKLEEDAIVIGGPTFLQACMQKGLIDEICICTILNVELGSGIRVPFGYLFGPDQIPFKKISILNSEELRVTLFRR